MDDKHKKMIAPIVITVLVVIYYVGLAAVFLAIGALPLIPSLILWIAPLGVAGAMIYVCVERIKEIRKGEEDDLSEY